MWCDGTAQCADHSDEMYDMCKGESNGKQINYLVIRVKYIVGRVNKIVTIYRQMMNKEISGNFNKITYLPA